MRSMARNHEVPHLALLLLLMLVPSTLAIASEATDLDSKFDKGEPLLCDAHCYCMGGKENHIVCNKTTAQVHKLTEQVYDTLRDGTPIKPKRTYVRVQNANQVLVTEGFLQEWEDYKSSALDFWAIEELAFEPKTNIPKRSNKYNFGGVGFINSTVHHLPKGLIHKYAASLLFHNTTVDRIPSQTLLDVKLLRYLLIEKSQIGLLQGSSTSKPIVLDRRIGNLQDMCIRDTIFGVIEANAIQIIGSHHYGKPEQFIMNNTRVGLLRKNAIQLEGALSIQVTDTWVLGMEADSLKINSSSSVNIVNNTLIGQPRSLDNLPCSGSTVVQGNIFIPVKSTVGSAMSPSNMDVDSSDSSTDSFLSTEQSEDETTRTDNTTPSYVTESSLTTTVIPMPDSLLQNPVTGSSLAEQQDYFHPSCMHNFIVSRDSIVREKPVADQRTSLLNSKFLMFFLMVCCVLLLISLICFAVSNKLKKNKKLMRVDDIYEEPTIHWSARPQPPRPFVLNSTSCPDRGLPVSHNPMVITVSDDLNREYENCDQPAQGVCYAKSLDRRQTKRNVPVTNEYCTMRSPNLMSAKGHDNSFCTLP
ncbi:uncharacterized protein LOC143040009 [Oratosquilla oratoria]|uniref:uncharacterized protein LOC143040009 n=1 Tax=Oratosquilla oratoria TaxID=337810 RepID=UPI003F76385D